MNPVNENNKTQACRFKKNQYGYNINLFYYIILHCYVYFLHYLPILLHFFQQYLTVLRKISINAKNFFLRLG